MKQIYLIRHCETKELAGEESSHPRNDSPLSIEGRQQAELLAEYLRTRPVDLFLTSIFMRSQQTAAIINGKHEVPVFSSMALNEYFLRDDYKGAETSDQGLVRSLDFINHFRPFFDRIGVVGHKSILSATYMSLLNMPFDPGKTSFSRPGTCRSLRYDPSLGDLHWQETDLFLPISR